MYLNKMLYNLYLKYMYYSIYFIKQLLFFIQTIQSIAFNNCSYVTFKCVHSDI